MRRDIKKTFKDPDSAFASFNFFGKKTIKMQDIINHNFITRFGFEKEDIKAYLLRDKVFTHEEAEINFTTFKKHFSSKGFLIGICNYSCFHYIRMKNNIERYTTF